MDTIGSVYRTAREERLDLDPTLTTASWVAEMSAQAIIDNARHATNHPAISAPHHVQLRPTIEDGFQKIWCACGVSAIARKFSRDERAGWWQLHQADASRHRACVLV